MNTTNTTTNTNTIEIADTDGTVTTQGLFTVEDYVEHEDGSATFSIAGSPEALQHLHQSLILQAVTNGIEHAKQKADVAIAELQALQAADKLVRYLDVWEGSDDLNYSPEVERIKNDLKDLLKKAQV